MAYSFLLLFLIIQSLLLLTSAKKMDLVDAMDTQVREMSTRQLAIGINNVYLETGSYPASAAALVAVPGFEYLRNTARPYQSVALATNLDDTVFKFNRATVFSQDPYATPLTDVAYLASNSCGTGGFTTAITWCGATTDSSQWWKAESRDAIPANLTRERKRLRRLLDKFTHWYNGDTSISTTNGVWGNNYPNPGVAAAALTALVNGFAQTATTCTGIYTWHGIPIDCTDLYSIWGTPTAYNYISAGHVTLVTKTPYTTSAGTALYVSSEESL